VLLWHKLAALCFGGALGTLARVGLSSWLDAELGKRLPAGVRFPWGTAAVNLLGCFLFGLIWALLDSHPGRTAALRLLLLAGFLGAFTTFSTFIFDVVRLSNVRWSLGLGNLVLQNLLGSLLLAMGVLLGRGH
jgi:fluoride exporter